MTGAILAFVLMIAGSWMLSDAWITLQRHRARVQAYAQRVTPVELPRIATMHQLPASLERRRLPVPVPIRRDSVG